MEKIYKLKEYNVIAQQSTQPLIANISIPTFCASALLMKLGSISFRIEYFRNHNSSSCTLASHATKNSL